jgi:hypothetical protein
MEQRELYLKNQRINMDYDREDDPELARTKLLKLLKHINLLPKHMSDVKRIRKERGKSKSAENLKSSSICTILELAREKAKKFTVNFDHSIQLHMGITSSFRIEWRSYHSLLIHI